MSAPVIPSETPDDGRGAEVMIAPGVRIAGSALTFSFSRSSGPGGQNVNKVNTHATLTVPLEPLREAMPPWAFDRLLASAGRYMASDRLVIHASDSRSQSANRKACLEKLRQVVNQAMQRPRRRRPSKPSRAAVMRGKASAKRKSKIKRSRKPPSGEE